MKWKVFFEQSGITNKSKIIIMKNDNASSKECELMLNKLHETGLNDAYTERYSNKQGGEKTIRVGMSGWIDKKFLPFCIENNIDI